MGRSTYVPFIFSNSFELSFVCSLWLINIGYCQSGLFSFYIWSQRSQPRINFVVAGLGLFGIYYFRRILYLRLSGPGHPRVTLQLLLKAVSNLFWAGYQICLAARSFWGSRAKSKGVYEPKP